MVRPSVAHRDDTERQCLAIDTLVVESFKSLDEHSQISAVDQALTRLVATTSGMSATEVSLIKRAAAAQLRELDLGTREIVEAAFERKPGPGDGSLWPEEQRWLDPVDLSVVLTELSDSVRRHVILSPEEADAIAVWVAYTYVFDEFDVSPFLAISSATKRSGKTTLLSTSVDGSKPAICGQGKTGNFGAAETSEFYFVPSSVRKSVCTLVRQLRGPHLSTCA